MQRFKVYLTRMVLAAAVVVIYFAGWKEVRSAFTTYLMIPQIEFAAEKCNESIGYEVASRTAVDIYSGSDLYRFNAPAGFYFLFAIFFIVLLKGEAKYYKLIIGYHLAFTVATLLTFYMGLCYVSAFLHLSAIGNAYITPFFTFFILILLISPMLTSKKAKRN